MAPSFPGIIEALKKLEPSVFGESQSAWGSENQGHREKIRLHLQNALALKGAKDLQSLTDLNKTPRPAGFSATISHTKGFGAWLACERPSRVGLDIEQAARISREICARVSTEAELQEAPRFEFLWCAKEAYFKALEKDQPSVIVPLKISGWEKLRDGLYAFKGDHAHPGRGLVMELPPYIIAACVVRDVST